MSRKTNVKGYTDSQLLNRVASLDSFKGFPRGYWLLGVRSNEDEFNVFDDKFYLFKEKQFITVTSGTTNPGATSLKNYQKYNKKGTFVMKSNQWFYDLWKFGYHNGRMPALKQNKPVLGYRDNNKDNKSEERGETVSGFFGINFHTISYGKKAGFFRRLIGGWSAGCQVLNDVEDYYKILGLLEPQTTTTYCLIKEF